jgi:squalene-hopene/tetraprenyl-beta-curcumene cyclase
MKNLLGMSTLLLALSISSLALTAEVTMDPAVRSKADQATGAGLKFLRSTQAEDGSWSKSVGVTALALRAFLESPQGYTEQDGDFISRPVKYLLAHVNEDGSISESNQERNYNTAVAVVALQATQNPDYAETIKKAQGFLKGLQLDESKGYKKDNAFYGGLSYGGDEKGPDLSNLYMNIEALRASGVASDDPAFQKALTFISRCQNRSESNDQSWAANDGGFTYMPGYSPNGGTSSYGGMTHAGLLSLLFAGADRNDPRVKAAYDWVRANYTLEDNPGAKGNQGLFYYYNVFSKSMYAFGDVLVQDTKGRQHNWRDDLSNQLVSMQATDGSWVNPYSTRWWEGDKNLATSWSVIALETAMR